MGGQGSGYYYRWNSKVTTESQQRIDVRWLKKQGYLQHGAAGSLSWSRRGETTGSITYKMETGRMVLQYRHRSKGSDWESVEQVIRFDETPCNYGGSRKWFLCPRCWRRIAILYGAGKYFYCRHCYDLTYASQQEGKVDRLMRKAWKIRDRLGADGGLSDGIFDKPKNMHQKTFNRLRTEAEEANRLSWILMGQRLGMDMQNEFLL